MIDTHLIIGRLGSGKTSCIRRLISQKPKNEKWAILVNEFGQIGLDAALLETQSNDGLNITEIAGGCICCAAQSQLRVSLNNLIRTYSPDRLIIEATGLGHPAAIIDLLRDEYMSKIIKVNSVIAILDLTLFDTSFDKITEKSPLTTESFSQQTHLADIIVLNKSDLVPEQNITNAKKYLDSIYPKKIQIIETVSGQLPINTLFIQTTSNQTNISHSHISDAYNTTSESFSFKDYVIESFCSVTNEHLSFGYIFPPAITFNRKMITHFIEGVFTNDIIRLKAIINCDKFWYAFNSSGSQHENYESFYRRDSRIEFITKDKLINREKIKTQLLHCTTNTK